MGLRIGLLMLGRVGFFETDDGRYTNFTLDEAGRGFHRPVKDKSELQQAEQKEQRIRSLVARKSGA